MKKKVSQRKKVLEIAPEVMAEEANLIYVDDRKPGYTRKLRGDHFAFYDTTGKLIKDEKQIKRIRALAIPPAYTDVWICPKTNGHLQATGRDAKGRKQYRYHPRWKEISDETKYEKMIAFGEALPALRKQVSKDLSLEGMPKEKVLAAIVNLLERTLIRVGNEEYARENQSFGLTTFRNKHVEVKGSTLTFNFKGKSGQTHKIDLTDKRLAKIVKHCKDLPGQDLFEYLDDNQKPVSISSTDVNEYLNKITNQPFTAKDFRTWAGTVFAVYALQKFEEFESEIHAKKNIVEAIEMVAKNLGNTPSVCRKSYVHPEIFSAYLEGKLVKLSKQLTNEEKIDLTGLSREESSILSFLKERLK